MDAEPPFFEAVIVPHRSLSARGLKLLIGAICTLSVCTTAVFWWLGAWPIAGFNGVEITTALLLLRHNARAVRANEVILLSASVLRIIRTDMKGQPHRARRRTRLAADGDEERPAACRASTCSPAATGSWSPPAWVSRRSRAWPAPGGRAAPLAQPPLR